MAEGWAAGRHTERRVRANWWCAASATPSRCTVMLASSSELRSVGRLSSVGRLGQHSPRSALRYCGISPVAVLVHRHGTHVGTRRQLRVKGLAELGSADVGLDAATGTRCSTVWLLGKAGVRAAWRSGTVTSPAAWLSGRVTSPAVWLSHRTLWARGRAPWLPAPGGLPPWECPETCTAASALSRTALTVPEEHEKVCKDKLSEVMLMDQDKHKKPGELMMMMPPAKQEHGHRQQACQL